MLFLDCEKWCLAHGKTMDELLKAGWDVGVGWQDGRPFHGTWSIRVNLALPVLTGRRGIPKTEGVCVLI